RAHNRVPTLHAHMARVLGEFGQCLNAGQAVVAGFLDCATYFEGPVFKINLWIIHVVGVYIKFVERRELGVLERGCQMMPAKQSFGHPIAEAKPLFQKRFLQPGNCKGAECDQRRELEQLPPGCRFEFTTFNLLRHIAETLTETAKILLHLVAFRHHMKMRSTTAPKVAYHARVLEKRSCTTSSKTTGVIFQRTREEKRGSMGDAFSFHPTSKRIHNAPVPNEPVTSKCRNSWHRTATSFCPVSFPGKTNRSVDEHKSVPG